MALGFQDCCNSSSYFLLTGIPASVQQFEVFYIVTLQGETFCAQYVELPKLNYQIPTYTLVTMTEKTSCSTCDDNNPCPPTQEIFLSQFGTGTIATSTDCYLKTIFPLVVSCLSTPPTANNASDGKLGVYVVGGIQPYIFYEKGTQLTNSPTIYSSTNGPELNQYIVRQNLPEGNYSLTITDSGGNFFEDITCTLDAPPPKPSISCVATANSYIYPNNTNSNDGTVTLTVTSNYSGQDAPFTIFKTPNTQVITLQQAGNYQISNLSPATYSYFVSGSAIEGFPSQNSTTVNCVVSSGTQITLPINLCISFSLCGQQFALTLIRTSNFVNNRNTYTLSETSRQKIGLASNTAFKIKWDNTNGWIAEGGGNASPDFDVDTSACSTTSGQFNLTSSYSGVIPASALPQNFTWNGGTGILQGKTITFTSGVCTLTAGINLSSSDLNFCAESPTWDLTFDFYAVGGIGPYNFRYRKQNTSTWYPSNTGGANLVQLVQNAPSINNTAGVYEVQAIDTGNNNTASVSVTFNVNSSCSQITVQSSRNGTEDTRICTTDANDVDYTLTITATIPNTLSGPHTVFFRLVGTNNSWSTANTAGSLPNTIVFTIYGNTTNNTNGQNYGPGNYEFYAQNNAGETTQTNELLITEFECFRPTPEISATAFGSCGSQEGQIRITLDNSARQPFTIILDGINYQTGVELSQFSPYYSIIVGIGTHTIQIIDTYGQYSNIVDELSVQNQEISISLTTIVNINVPSYYSYVNDSQIFSPAPGTANYNLSQNGDFITLPQMCTSPNDNYYIDQFAFWNYPIEINYTVSGLGNGKTLAGYFKLTMKMQNVYNIFNPRWLYPFDSAYVNDQAAKDLKVQRCYNEFYPDVINVGSCNSDYLQNPDANAAEFMWIGHLSMDEAPAANQSYFTKPNSSQTFPLTQYPTSIITNNNTPKPQTSTLDGDWRDKFLFTTYVHDNSYFDSDGDVYSTLNNSARAVNCINIVNGEPVGQIQGAFDGCFTFGRTNETNASLSNSTIINNLCDNPGYSSQLVEQGRPAENVFTGADGNAPNQTYNAGYLTSSQSEIYYGRYNGFNLLKKEFQFGDSSNPLTLSNGSGTLKMTYKGHYPNLNTDACEGSAPCMSSKGFEIKLQFVKTNSIACAGGIGTVPLNFNGDTGNASNEFTYYQSTTTKNNEGAPPTDFSSTQIFF